MKKTLLTVAFLMFTIFSLFAQTSASKTEKIKTFLEISGSSKMGMQAINQIITAFKTQQPNMSNHFWDDFLKEVNADDLTNLVIPIYDKYYTEKDLDGLIAFYQTDLGKRVLEKTPLIMQESMQVGQVWGKAMGEKVIKKIQENKAKN
ncbi:DUF2059 domain-containing protein [Pedobacter alpinus]|uniref:DUF2059 domain-containing protein n=1 Tax=Pedobacter alpinus TaxID=1590643 RepID=A0ABW5TSG5_9SPHI